ncbi:MAG TPA: zinc ribbon domain-containing protein [Candidatus Acidoferrales bacterium]|nr:zinc ribbon domain-containing protein [Candidatus Acidoferrales bacterium]
MIVFACAALTLAALLYVFWLTPEPVRVKSAMERDLEFLQQRREVVYDNLRDLHLEFRMGKLSEQDYQLTKARYQEELALLLHEVEKLGGPAPAPHFVPGRCARCGRDNPADNRFCGACGAELPRVENA